MEFHHYFRSSVIHLNMCKFYNVFAPNQKISKKKKNGSFPTDFHRLILLVDDWLASIVGK